jgi:hypothetical protein
MESKIYQTNPINTVFGDSNLLLSILSFLYEKTDKSHDFLTNTPIALHILSFKSLYNEFHKIPNLQIQSYPIHYISSFSVFQWAIGMGYSGNIFHDFDLFKYIIDEHMSAAIHFIDYVMTKPLSFYNFYAISDYATEYNYIHLLEQIKLKNPAFIWDKSYSLDNAASSGHLQVMQWLRSQNPPCPWSSFVWHCAAEAGHLHILKWLRIQDLPRQWNESTCTMETQSGDLHFILQWLRSQNPPYPWWCSKSCTAAAYHGHLHILQWLRSQNPPCPWNINECIKVVKPENSHIIEWLEAQT